MPEALGGLPRYRKAGVLLADIPRLDFASARESAQSSRMLTERLDRVTQWALGEAADLAKEEGLQYGADNPVTLTQLRDAVTAERNPSELFAKRGTVYGDAARSAQVAALTSDIEIDAQEKVNLLKLGVERGEVDLLTARDELKSLLDGYAAGVKTIDPKASLKLRASLGTIGNSAYLAMTQTFVKKQDERKKIALDAWITNTLPEAVRTHFEAGDTLDPETNRFVTPQQRIEATLRATMQEQVNNIADDEYARQAIRRYVDTVEKARVNAVTGFVTGDEFMRDPSAALTRIRKGDLGHYAATWSGMTEDQREKVVVNFMQEAGRIHTFAERDAKVAEDGAKREVYALLSKYWTANGPERNTLRAEIVAKGARVLSFDQLKTLLKPAEGEKENVSLEIRAVDLVRRGGVGDLAEVQRRVPGLQPKQIKRVQDMIYDAGDRQLREGVRNLAGIPDGLVQLSGDQQRRFAALNTEMERIKGEEIEKNTKAGNAGMYNPVTVLGKLREAKDRVTADKAVEAARMALEGFSATRRARITENTSEQELKKLGYSAAEINEIRRRQRTIRGE